MQPRNIPQIVPRGVRPKASVPVEEKPKPPPSDSDDYGDDFEVVLYLKIFNLSRRKMKKKFWRVNYTKFNLNSNYTYRT